jgi:hypothetical protein
MNLKKGARAPLLAVCALLLVFVPAVAGCSSGSPPPSPPSTSQSDYNQAYTIGLQAYTYGLPLLETNKTFLSMTSINVSNNDGFGPVNQFNHVRQLNDPSSTAVVAPGANALSSIAWLDLTTEPQVLHVPEVTDHYFVLPLLDPYTEDVVNLGSAHDTPPGDYVICGPGQHDVQLPAGTQRINMNYTRVWIVGSTQLKGQDDVANVNKIQDSYTLTPLSKYGTSYVPPAPAQPDTTIENYSVPTGLAFLDTLGQLLQQFPPPAADNDQIAAFATVGIGPGKTPSKDGRLSADTIRGLTDAVAAGPAQIQADLKTVFEASAKKHNGYFLGGFGAYGTDYQLRAVVAEIGLGAFTSDQAIFAVCVTDGNTKALDGSSSYVMHMPAPPPGGEGWTITVYNTKGALIQNPINRYEFSNSSTLTKNADGSVDIHVQAAQPADAAQAQNWLPVASGQGFEVIWRLMAPEPDTIDGILNGTGWQPPAPMPAGTAGT